MWVQDKQQVVLKLHMLLKEFNLPPTQLQFITDRPGQVDIHLSSTEKAKISSNWTASIPLEEGICQTLMVQR